MAKCPYCNSDYEEYYIETLLTVCPECRTKSIRLTNEDWFCELPTEEKAEWLDKVAENCCQLCDEERREFCNKSIARDCEFENAKKWEMWLKQPHREESEK